MTRKEMTAENGITVRFRRWWKDCNTRKVLSAWCLASYVGSETTETKTKKYFLTIAGAVCCRRQRRLLSQHATGDKRCVHPFDPKKKMMEWHNTTSLSKKLTDNAILNPLDHGNCLLECWMIQICRVAATRRTTNDDLCFQVLQKLLSARRAKLVKEGQRQPTIPQSTVRQRFSARGEDSNKGWKSLSRPPYSPDLAPSDFHLVGFVKDQRRGRRYANTEVIQEAVWLCL